MYVSFLEVLEMFNFPYNFVKASIIYGPVNLFYNICQYYHHFPVDGVIDFSMANLIFSIESESDH